MRYSESSRNSSTEENDNAKIIKRFVLQIFIIYDRSSASRTRADTISFGTSFRYRWGRSFRNTKMKFRRASDVHSISTDYRRQILIRRESSQSLFNVDEDGNLH